MGVKVDDIIKSMNKDFKEELVHRGISAYDYERIPFTSPRLNYMTFGGIPMGKITEFFGENHGGKALRMDCKIEFLMVNSFVRQSGTA